MLTEIVERLGHTFDWWESQPLAFLRLVYGHLQELDRRRQWIQRAQALDQAWLVAKAFHDPNILKDDHRMLIASAGSHKEDQLTLIRGERMAAELDYANVMEGSNVPDEG
jgi:hypothetical protein